MYIRWHCKVSSKQKMPGSGAMGATFGILEFLSQTNNNAESIPVENRFIYFDDLTTLEVVNLLSIGLSSFNVRYQVPSDLPLHGQYVDHNQLKSKIYLQQLNKWSEDH